MSRQTTGLSVMFGEAFEVPIADLDAAQRYGWEVAGDEAYPNPIHVNPGRSMRPPLAWELELLEACLRAVPRFLQSGRTKPSTNPLCPRRRDAAGLADVEAGSGEHGAESETRISPLPPGEGQGVRASIAPLALRERVRVRACSLPRSKPVHGLSMECRLRGVIDSEIYRSISPAGYRRPINAQPTRIQRFIHRA